MEKLTPRAIIFDLGSTLIEYPSTTWEEVSVRCVAGARGFLIKRGYDVPGEDEFYTLYQEIKNDYRKTAEETLVEWTVPQVAGRLFQKLSVDGDEQLVDRFFDAYYKSIEKHLYILDDVLVTLEKVKARYGTVGLVSNTVFPERVHLGELKRFGIRHLLDFTVFSSTFGLRKPHPDIFYRAANLAGYAPSECVYIGDRYFEDVTGPGSVGMSAILRVHEGREYPADMPDATRRIDTLSQLDRHFDF